MDRPLGKGIACCWAGMNRADLEGGYGYRQANGGRPITLVVAWEMPGGEVELWAHVMAPIECKMAYQAHQVRLLQNCQFPSPQHKSWSRNARKAWIPDQFRNEGLKVLPAFTSIRDEPLFVDSYQHS